MCDRYGVNPRAAVFILAGDDDRTGAVLYPFFAAGHGFAVPKVGIADDEGPAAGSASSWMPVF